MKLLVVLIILLPISLFSQGIRTFDLNSCIEYAVKKGPASKSAKSAFKARTGRINAFKAGLLPQLNFNASLPGLSREIIPVMQPDGIELFRPQSQYFGSGGLSLSQRVAELGSELTVFSGISRIDAFGTRDYSLWRTTPLVVSYRQPILIFNQLKWETKIQDIREYINDNEYSADIERISVSVASRFFDLYIAKMNLQNAEQNIRVNDTLYTISKGRFDVGRIAENDLLQSELAFLNAQNAYERALLDYEQAMDEFRIEIGINDNSVIEINPPLFVPKLSIDADYAVLQAIENNPSIKNLEIEGMRADMNLRQAESNNRLNVNLFASYGFNNSAEMFDDAYRDLLHQQRLDLTLQVPIFRFGRGDAEIETALEEKFRTEIDTELERKNLEIEVKYQALRINQLIKQVEIAAKADTIAARRFEVAINRYYIGKIDLNSFFIAQNEKDSAFQNYIQLLKNFWTSYYNIRRQTLYDFVQNRKIIHIVE